MTYTENPGALAGASGANCKADQLRGKDSIECPVGQYLVTERHFYWDRLSNSVESLRLNGSVTS